MSMKGEPATPRRRTKSLLLTIVGEIMVPSKPSVWQEAMVESLGTLGVSVAAARQAVARAVGDEWLTSERIGRRSLLTLTQETAHGLQESRARMINFGAPREWNGEWVFVALTVPEESRALRHHFRTELAWLGFGSLGNGLWISPHVENEKATLKLLDSVDGPRDAYVYTSARAASHNPRQLANAAWDLASLRTRYEDFCSRFENEQPQNPSEIFASWIDMHTSWRHFPLFDPELPDRLLPRDWPRHRVVALFHEKNDEWGSKALEYFISILEGS